KINIESDNKNLMYDGELSKRAYRWKFLIEEYEYTLKHISGEKNKDADLLSRYLLRTEIKFKNRNNLLKLPTIKHAKLMNTGQIRVESPKLAGKFGCSRLFTPNS
ncbi:hypothetical protein DMUE_6162, partial [Dictyocoela muelleri]